MHNDAKKVTGPELADCPEDGGKWALYCEHYDATGELIGCGIVQDTNKKRLAPWRKETSMWCCYCQEEAA